MRKLYIISLIAILSVLVAGCSDTGNVTKEEYVKLSLADLSDKVQYFTYEDRGVAINYFAVLGSDGKPRTAFDACDVCGGYKGYAQIGTDIKCRNCGRVFSIDGLGTKNKGYGCWPSYLPHTVEGGDVLIKISDLEASRQRFA